MASGGMPTKLAAARIALDAGCSMAIASGIADNPLHRLETEDDATWFITDQTPVQARKRWIAGGLAAEGEVWIDAGAARALGRGNSLLPAGATRIDGKFERGAPVIVRGPDGREVARGLIAYSAEDARRILGMQSADFADALGYHGRAALIRRDDMSMTGRAGSLSREEALPYEP
jgi:glutamate 5-kinase